MLLIIIYAATGAVAGLLAGLFGVGGGIIIIPALTLIFAHQPDIIHTDNLMHFVVGTSLAAILPTTLSALHAQLRRGASDLSLFKQLFPGILIGTVVGAVLSIFFLQGQMVKTAFGAFMLFVAIQMFIGLKHSSMRQLGAAIRWIGSLLLGTLSGILGVGGGVLMTPWLHYFNVPIRQAITTSTACGIVVSFTGALIYAVIGLRESVAPAWSTGYIYWPAVLAISLVSPLFAHLGVAISYHLPVQILKRIFAVFVFCVGLRMLW